MSTTAMLETTPSLLSNLSNTTNSTIYVKVYNEAWVVVSGIILLIFLIFGLLANSVTIAVIRSSTKLKNGYYVVLGSLCVSDLISALTSILFWYRRTLGYELFRWPLFFCKLYWAVDMWTTFSTACHIFAFALLRFTAIKFPIFFKTISNARKVKWIVGGIWFFTFVAGFIPHFLFNTIHPESRLSDINRSRWASCSLDKYWIPIWKVYVEIAYIFFIYIPAGSVFVLTIAIIAILQQRKRQEAQMKSGPNNHGRKTVVADFRSQDESTIGVTSGNGQRHAAERKRKHTLRRPSKNLNAAFQLLLIFGSFLFGYVPLTVFHFNLHYPSGTFEQNQREWNFAMVQYIMLRFSECLNPVFYNLASRKMWHETRAFLGKLSKRFEMTTTTAASRSSVSVGSASNEREL